MTPPTTTPSLVEPATEADVLGRGMARVIGRAGSTLEQRIADLEFRLDTCIEPHLLRCTTRQWDTCDCGLRELMEPRP